MGHSTHYSYATACIVVCGLCSLLLTSLLTLPKLLTPPCHPLRKVTASPSPLIPLPLFLSFSPSPPTHPTPLGEPVLWYERCRIRHLLTQQYLAVERREGQNVLTLKESKPGPEFDQDTQFRLFPVISGEDEIKYETYARINHPHTKTWLHANKGVYVRVRVHVCMRVLCRLYTCDSIIKSTIYV